MNIISERRYLQMGGSGLAKCAALLTKCVAALALVVCLGLGVHKTPVLAQELHTIRPGVFAGEVDLSGMSGEEASAAIQSYVDSLRSAPVTLQVAGGKEVSTTAGELGIVWRNSELVDEAMNLGYQGNIVQRYKTLRDLEHESKTLPILLDFNVESINHVLTNKCAVYDQKAVSASLKRENGAFTIVPGQTGYALDVETSIDLVHQYMTEQWHVGDTATIALDVKVDEPQGTTESLSEVKDLLGTFTTSYSSSGASRSANIANGCHLVDGHTVYPGEEFSVLGAITPFTEGNGYHLAGSYLNGKVVDSLGGGICQVSTTLYNAVLRSELEVSERHNHSMIVSYVDPAADAAIAESASKDFKFVNNTDYPIYIEGYTSNKKITFNIYGRESRSAGRKVAYVSEVLETIAPGPDKIYADGGQPIGFIVTESSHTGYKARLWKVVTENGAEVSRTQVNSSNYKMTPKSATVGTASGDPNAQNEIMAAIGTGSIDHVKNVIAALSAPPVTQEVDSAEVAAE